MIGPSLACDPKGIPPGEREAHFALIGRLFAAALERTELPDGTAFRFPAERLLDIARFADNERRCCPFLAFTIEVRPTAADLTLRITGPEGVQELLAAELESTDALSPVLPG